MNEAKQGLIAALAALTVSGTAFAQATVAVQANEHYFQGAIYGTWTDAAPGCNTGNAYSNAPASIGGVQYTATGNRAAGSGYCSARNVIFTTPPGNDAPTATDQFSLRQNTVTLKTVSAPFPTGTVLAF